MADVPRVDGLVNNLVYEKVPDATNARIWTVWFAVNGDGDVVGTLLDFRETRFGRADWQSPITDFGSAAVFDRSAIILFWVIGRTANAYLPRIPRATYLSGARGIR